MGELTKFSESRTACIAHAQKRRVPAAPPGIAGLIAAHPGLANSQFPFFFPQSDTAVMPLDSVCRNSYGVTMEIALFQPDIAGNVGTTLRTAACFDVAAHIIEPCGFPFSDHALKRAGMDYAVRANVRRHADWNSFHASIIASNLRPVLLTTTGATPLPDFAFASNDILLLGAESTGVPAYVHDAAAARVAIPMQTGFRSLNVAVAAGIALAEALRQTKGFPA